MQKSIPDTVAKSDVVEDIGTACDSCVCMKLNVRKNHPSAKATMPPEIRAASGFLCIFMKLNSLSLMGAEANRKNATTATLMVLIVFYGAPGITEEQLKEAVETTLSYIRLVSGGETEMVKVFESSFAENR